MPQALLLRHGESVSNAHPEAPTLPEEVGDQLTEKGLEQSKAAAEALEGLGITRLLSSPMRRALETADAVGELLGMPITVLPYAHELIEEADFGRLSAEEQAMRCGVTRMAAHPNDADHTANGSESFNDIIERVRRLRLELESISEHERALVITHGVFTRFFFLHLLLGESFRPGMASLLWGLRSRNCGLSLFEFNGNKDPADVETPTWTCITWMARPWNPL